ncbi:DNRLRE domain-containing protein [Mariniflexile ostreae]|uniref:DNRLRE domain-containing protein n=1 Tax=Mariniflexile ostreae TaxID=1520892 RepID=A0ABV5FBR4_9FLAO
MNIMNIKFYKEKSKILLTLVAVIFLSVTYSCVENEDTVYGIEDEPDAAIGFVQKEATVLEGDKAIQIEVNTSKFLYEDVTVDLAVASGDAAGVVFSDSDGNEGTTFTIQKGAKSISLNLRVENDNKYTGTRNATFTLENLKGDGVYITEQNVGGEEKRLNFEFKLTIEDDAPVPPSVGFNALAGEVSEDTTEAHKAIIEFTTPAVEPGSFDIIYSGTAIAGTDYNSDAVNGVQTVDFQSGAQTIEIEIAPVNNAVVDGNKSIILTISNVSEGFFIGEVPAYELTIVDDDLPIKESTIITEADAWTRGKNGSGKSDDNGGDKADLVMSGGDKDDDFREFYLKFDLAGIDPSKVIEAKIVLTTTRESNWLNAETNFGGITTQSMYHVIDDSWEEMSITANTMPAAGTSPIATFTSDFLIGETTLSSLQHEFDVTAQVQIETDGKLSVRLNTGNTLGQRLFYASREHVNNTPPRLVVVEDLQ